MVTLTLCHPCLPRPDPLGRDHEYHGPCLPPGDREWHLRHVHQAGQPAEQDGEYRMCNPLQINATFKNTLDLIPNGILLIDIKSQKITFASREMKTLVGATEDESDYNFLQSKVCSFLIQDQEMPKPVVKPSSGLDVSEFTKISSSKTHNTQNGQRNASFTTNIKEESKNN